jgi:hypothetical protein
MSDNKQPQVIYPLPPDEETMKMICASFVTDEQKWRISVLSGLIFLLLSSPLLYQFTSSIAECVGVKLANAVGCPSVAGLLVHTVVFILIVKLLMQ